MTKPRMPEPPERSPNVQPAWWVFFIEEAERECFRLKTNRIRIIPQCHPRAGLRVTYEAGSGALTLRCAVCGELMTRVAMAFEGMGG